MQFDKAQFYGLGWVINRSGSFEIINHTGSLTTGSSDFILIPNQNLAVGVMVNLSSRHTVEIAEGIVALLQGSTPAPSSIPPEREPSSFKPDPKVLAKYTGTYQTGSGPIEIFVDGNKLMGRAGDALFELEAYADNDFVVRGAVGALEGYPVSFSLGGDDQVTLLLARQPFGQKK